MATTIVINDEQAQSFQEHRKYLQHYALRELRDPSLAEDAVQETLISAFAQHKKFQGRSQLRTWLTVILKRKIIDLFRSRSRGLPADALMLGKDEDPADGAFDAKGRWVDPPADWGMPDAALESSQFWGVYQDCCKRLSERDASVFAMREVEGLSSEEICSKMNISMTNLHVILFRARTSLRACMSKNWLGGIQQGEQQPCRR